MKHKYFGGFTLIEVLLAIGIIMVLISGLMMGVNKANHSAMLTKNKNLLVQAGRAIQSFEQDFGELPATTALIVSEKSLKNYAAAKGIGISKEGAYLDAVPTYGGVYWGCMNFNLYDSSTFGHYHRNISAEGNPGSSFYTSKTCQSLGGSHASGGPIYLITPTAAFYLADYWGNIVMYQVDSATDSFKLISGGPDGKIESSNGSIANMLAGTYAYVGTGPLDKDNIVMEFN